MHFAERHTAEPVAMALVEDHDSMPRFSRRQFLRADFAYKYLESDEGLDGCVTFRVENVHLLPTLEAEGHATGQNVIRMYYVEAPHDDPHEVRNIRVATKIVDYSVRSGASPTHVEVVPEDFVVLGQ